jgi:hypothetical protein
MNLPLTLASCTSTVEGTLQGLVFKKDMHYDHPALSFTWLQGCMRRQLGVTRR